MIAWLDLETTGLDPKFCSIVEVAILLTDDKFDAVGECHTTVRPPVGRDWEPTALEMHRASGLYDELLSGLDYDDAERFCIEFVIRHASKHSDAPGPWPLAGSTIGFDRSFLRTHWPRLHDLFHYRSIDVSSFKEVISRTFDIDREMLPPKKALTKHRAFPDVEDSLMAMRWYKLNCLTIPQSLRITH